MISTQQVMLEVLSLKQLTKKANVFRVDVLGLDKITEAAVTRHKSAFLSDTDQTNPPTWFDKFVTQL